VLVFAALGFMLAALAINLYFVNNNGSDRFEKTATGGVVGGVLGVLAYFTWFRRTPPESTTGGDDGSEF